MDVYQEIQAMSDFIHNAKKEISSIKSENPEQDKFLEAKDELDAVVAATEKATGTIMDRCEEIESVANTIPDKEAAEKITHQVTQIYEACTFQDITGQRINKVIDVMKFIEVSLAKLLEGTSSDEKSADVAPLMEKKELTDADLMNGPQLDGQGMGQDDVDKLLADLDD